MITGWAGRPGISIRRPGPPGQRPGDPAICAVRRTRTGMRHGNVRSWLTGSDRESRPLRPVPSWAMPGGAWNGSWNGSPGIPAPPVLSVRFPVLSVQLMRPVDEAVVMVRRRCASIPQQFAAMIVGELAALGVAPPTPLTDVEGLDPDAAPVRPAESVRVTEADPLRLGVHAAISAPGMPDDGPSEYVPRDSIPPSQGSGPVLDPGQQTPDGHALDVIAEIAGEALCGGSGHGQGETLPPWDLRTSAAAWTTTPLPVPASPVRHVLWLARMAPWASSCSPLSVLGCWRDASQTWRWAGGRGGALPGAVCSTRARPARGRGSPEWSRCPALQDGPHRPGSAPGASAERPAEASGLRRTPEWRFGASWPGKVACWPVKTPSGPNS